MKGALKTIAPDTVVSIEMELRDAQGELIHSSEAPVTYLHGGYAGVFDALERALEGKRVGESAQVQLEPEEAFGDYDADLVRVEPCSRYGEGLEVGMEIEDAFDEDEPRTWLITDLAADQLVLDGNHPLAGIALRFSCKVLAVRPASAQEVARGEPDGEREEEEN